MKMELLFLLALLVSTTGVAIAASEDGYVAPSIGTMQVTPDKRHHKKKPVKVKIKAPTINIGVDISALQRLHRPSTTTTKKQAAKPRPAPIPVRIEPPQYPAAARSRPRGYVVVEFTVTASGHTSHIAVVQSSPRNVFDTAAINAVRQWRFKPYRVDGKPASTRVRQRIQFSP